MVLGMRPPMPMPVMKRSTVSWSIDVAWLMASVKPPKITEPSAIAHTPAIPVADEAEQRRADAARRCCSRTAAHLNAGPGCPHSRTSSGTANDSAEISNPSANMASHDHSSRLMLNQRIFCASTSDSICMTCC